MERCVLCKGKLKEHREKKEEIEINGWKCSKCSETYFSSNEILRWEVLSGKRRDNVRKIRRVGNSLSVTFPNIFVKEDEIHDNDLAIFKKTKKGYLLQIIHPETG